MFHLICARRNGKVNNRDAGDFRRYRAHYDVIVMNRKLAQKTILTLGGLSRKSFRGIRHHVCEPVQVRGWRAVTNYRADMMLVVCGNGAWW